MKLTRISTLLVLLQTLHCLGAEVKLPFPGKWDLIDRATLEKTPKSIIIQNGYVASQELLGDCELKFRARAPKGEEQVQIWAGVRFRDRESRYAIGLRGGNNNDLYFFRYAPDGGARLLGIAYLDFQPKVDTWYDLRILAKGKRIQVYLGDEKVPRLNTEDTEAVWEKGGVVLGGGWLKAEYSQVSIKPLEGESLAQFQAAGKTLWKAPDNLDREALRSTQRAAYKPVVIEKISPGRQEVSLNGQWLFMPEQDLEKGCQPLTTEFDDSRWHIMGVPAFWTPSLGWLHGQPGFTYLKDYTEGARTAGISDNIFNQEIARLDGCSFNWRETKGAWYRQRLVMPESLSGKHFELKFDAIAKVSKVWVNGKLVGSHVGMFGEVNCDITSALKPGENVITVHVAQDWRQGGADDDEIQGVAVTVAVTKAMLRSLPHAIYQPTVAGIWQPVKLVATAPTLIDDIYVQPNLTGAKVDVTLKNTGASDAPVELSYSIASKKEGAVLSSMEKAATASIAASKNQTVQFETEKVTPKLWTPSEPNLYNLEVRLLSNGTELDRKTVTFGFRTFGVDGDHLMLNGKPYWLRGGNHFPVYLRPNDAEYARGFLKLAHEGNVRATRTVCAPMTEAWLEACDEIGIGVSYEGIWPWLMLKGAPPEEKLLNVWKEDFSSLIRKYRNHPSLLIWTVNNEMKFYIFERDDTEVLKRKWTVVSDMIKQIRSIDPTRPIVADSGYVRKEGQKEKVLTPNGIDDGDIDDTHRYYGWYDPSFFHYFKGEYGQEVGTRGRPLISQEMCGGGYARSDDGHPTRSYLFVHSTPLSLTGDKAWPEADPAFFLKRQAFMIKELAETIRRTSREDSAGILHFCYSTWFRNLLDLQKIQPFEAYYAYKAAHAPVLVSAELFGRHAYAGTVLKRRVCIANDSEDCTAIPASQLTWSVEANNAVLSKGTVSIDPVDYYTNKWMDVEFKMPEKVPGERVNAQLKLKLEANGKLISENFYDLVVASPKWAKGAQGATEGKGKTRGIALFDPHNLSTAALEGISISQIDSLAQLATKTPNLLVIGDAHALADDANSSKQFKDYLQAGGKALLLNPGVDLQKLFPDQIRSYRALTEKNNRTEARGEVVTMKVPESPVFNGIEPFDLSWFEMGPPKLPYACVGDYQIDRSRPEVTALAWHLQIHGYLTKPADIVNYGGTPLLEIKVGKGRVISSEMAFESVANDPVARRLLNNLLGYLQGGK